MIKNDLILRLIEQISQALARIVAARRRDDLDAAEAETEGALRDLVGLDGAALIRLGPGALVNLLATYGDVDIRGYWAGRLLKERGDNAEARADAASARDSYVAAFSLFDELDQKKPLAGEAAELFAWLVQKLSC